MPERGFASETWDSDEWFQELSERQRYLFIYLWTNGHCNQAGLYHITLTTISFATKIPKEELSELISSLAPKVKWWPEDNLVWVKNFLKRQSKSSKFLAAAAKSLTTVKNSSAIQELLDYNMRRYSISIPYQYYIDKVSILTRVTVPVPDTGSGPVSDKGGGEGSSARKKFLALAEELREVLIRLPEHKSYIEEHEAIKQRLLTFGSERGYITKSEFSVKEGRVDLCWLSHDGAIIFGFEIDSKLPRYKSLVKLRQLGAAATFVILRRSPTPYQWEQDILLVGLNRPKLKDEMGNEEEGEEQIPRSRLETEETLCEGDREIISVWCSVKGFDMTPADASALVARLRTEFPDVDILAESKTWAARKLTEPLDKDSRPSQQIWNFMRKARQFTQERSQRGQVKGERAKARPREAFRGGKW